MFCDGDTYLTKTSLEMILAGLSGEGTLGGALDRHFFLASRYHIPISLHNHSAGLEEIDAFIRENKSAMDHDCLNKTDFMGTATAYLMHRSIWHECRGFDERLIYWGWFDIDLFHRLRRRYEVVDLENTGIEFFHLEHYSNSRKRDRVSENPQRANRRKLPRKIKANREDWGLVAFPLAIAAAGGRRLELESALEKW